MRRTTPSWVGVSLLHAGSVRSSHALGSFVTFETGPVRPLALSPDGTRLFAANGPDNRLEIFAVDGAGNLTHTGSVPVGMEPVAVAARTNTEVWVVNHLSDSVSIVSLASSPPRVVNTLLVGDEPRDIVFAGPGGNRAFITTAHRGQNSGVPYADLIAEGIGRADVWVFDATSLGTTLGGTPVQIDVKLDVWDSPNSGGSVVIDVVRAAKIAMDRGISGPLIGPSAFAFKHPPEQMPYEVAKKRFNCRASACCSPRVARRPTRPTTSIT